MGSKEVFVIENVVGKNWFLMFYLVIVDSIYVLIICFDKMELYKGIYINKFILFWFYLF